MLNELYAKSMVVHDLNAAAGWWKNPVTGENLLRTRDRLNLIALMHSELGEAYMAGTGMDDKLPELPGRDVEIADAQIRAFDFLGSELKVANLDLVDARVYPTICRSSEHTRAALGEWFEAARHEFDSAVRNIPRFAVPPLWLETLGFLRCALDLTTEHYRKGRKDRACGMIAVFIERCDIAHKMHGISKIPLAEIARLKMQFNATRADHKLENRLADGGKIF